MSTDSAALPTALLCALLSGTSASADPDLFCAGDYAVVSGTVTGTAAGSQIDLVRTTNDGIARLSYSSCESATLTLQGRMITLSRPTGSPQWSAQTPGGGGTLQFRFEAGPPTRIAARMSTSDGTMTVRRGSRFTLQAAAGQQPLECFDKEETPGTPESNVAAGFIAALGKTPHPDYRVSDYFSTDVTDAGDPAAGVLPSFEIRFRLSLDGELLPKVADAEMFRAACDGRDLEPTRKILSIKLFPVDPGYSAFARVIDVETSRIQMQAEGQADGQSFSDAVAAAMAAYDRMGGTAGQMGDVWAD